ncbi:hypothetical protein ACFE04_002571 [Oxalis oulophora]
MSQAEYYYTQGINCIPLSESSRSSAKLLLVCYINRAATRISLKMIREALGACIAAVALDSSFLKAYMRGVTHVGGDMFKSIPSADAIFMKDKGPSRRMVVPLNLALRWHSHHTIRHSRCPSPWMTFCGTTFLFLQMQGESLVDSNYLGMTASEVYEAMELYEAMDKRVKKKDEEKEEN